MKSILASLLARAGAYQGEGINHEGQRFVGTITIAPILEKRGAAVTFIARGLDGEVYHQEQTWIAPDHQEQLHLWTISNHGPGVFQHELRSEETSSEGASQSVVFGFNESANPYVFREEIRIDLWSNGDVGYHYAWGLPNEDFAPRSGLRMSRNVPFGLNAKLGRALPVV